MNDKFLEQLYEYVILIRYRDVINTKKIEWTDHGKVGLNAWAHYFKTEDDKKNTCSCTRTFPAIPTLMATCHTK